MRSRPRPGRTLNPDSRAPPGALFRCRSRTVPERRSGAGAARRPSSPSSQWPFQCQDTRALAEVSLGSRHLPCHGRRGAFAPEAARARPAPWQLAQCEDFVPSMPTALHAAARPPEPRRRRLSNGAQPPPPHRRGFRPWAARGRGWSPAPSVPPRSHGLRISRAVRGPRRPQTRGSPPTPRRGESSVTRRIYPKRRAPGRGSGASRACRRVAGDRASLASTRCTVRRSSRIRQAGTRRRWRAADRLEREARDSSDSPTLAAARPIRASAEWTGWQMPPRRTPIARGA